MIASGGSAYLLKGYGSGGSAHDIDTTYAVDASSERATGVWRLRVRDNAGRDIGKIDSWALQF